MPGALTTACDTLYRRGGAYGVFGRDHLGTRREATDCRAWTVSERKCVSTYEVGGVNISAAPFDECLDAIITDVQRGRPRAGIFVNANTIAVAARDERFKAMLNSSLTTCFSDGMPLVWVGRHAYGVSTAQWPRVYGPDFMEAMLARRDSDLRHFLLGGTPQTLDDLRGRIAERWSSATVVGAESPPFRALTDEERQEQDERIISSGANVVWVGLGSPKQDWEAHRIASDIGVVALGVGAAFDFLAGTKVQAPLWMQRSGLEWAFRLGTEPRRLATRYLRSNPRFIAEVARQPGLRRRRV